MKSLLEKALAVKHQIRTVSVSDEEIELAVAWAKGTVTYTQVRSALNPAGSTMSVYIRLALGLREHIRRTEK